ncbi:MAG: alcohol dehydrogenase catalytic domain-containing protein [Sedimentisphaerales bacterium]|nr:alcohol dehydrogenase catalytic domain-containing protein [Sedimentisphaerales bacterium]
MSNSIPETQYAVQLIGPDELTLNTEKAVFKPGAYQVLGQVEAVGLCFSDLKLLKQFSQHARKTAILSGIDPAILAEIPSYVPDDKPTVPGHESVVRIVAVGDDVKGVKVGDRFLVQTDYRWLPTANSNGSYGYNFEGGLQEYVLMDQRVITSPDGESMLIPVSENLSASAVALVEPWACVEDAYAVQERRTLKVDGSMLVISDAEIDKEIVNSLCSCYGRPTSIKAIENANAALVGALEDASFDDVVYFGSTAEIAEKLFPKVAPKGLYNIVQNGKKFGKLVTSQVGRVHYGGIRVIGTTSNDPADAMAAIPTSGEIRVGDKINVIGAAGPMGVMHVIRNLCQGVRDITVYAGDLSDERLAILSRLAQPLAQKNGLEYVPYNPKTNAPTEAFDYIVLMAPVPALLAMSVLDAADKAIINIFAGIPANVNADIDLDAYIEKQLYFVGTSGSVLDDMKCVLEKVESGQLDTNLSVAAITGPEGAVEGIRAVENHLIPGKIIVYPQCKGLGLTTLEQLPEVLPNVAGALDDGLWTTEAEKQLLKK